MGTRGSALGSEHILSAELCFQAAGAPDTGRRGLTSGCPAESGPRAPRRSSGVGRPPDPPWLTPPLHVSLRAVRAAILNTLTPPTRCAPRLQHKTTATAPTLMLVLMLAPELRERVVWRPAAGPVVIKDPTRYDRDVPWRSRNKHSVKSRGEAELLICVGEFIASTKGTCTFLI